MPETQLKIHVPGNELMPGLLGQRDELLRLVEDAFRDTSIRVRGNEISIEGPDAERVGRIFNELVVQLRAGQWLDAANVGRTIDMVRANLTPSKIVETEVVRGAHGKPVRPLTAGQRRYVDAIRTNTITFGIGPAGTGKSYLAVAAAVHELQSKTINRIILARPAVEAGERLGFLPGDLMAKVDPYLRPLYDALYDMLEPEGTQRLLERGTIEVAPLAFMRGRTLNSSFVILDEAQNTTPEQMKMFLTRIGFGTRAVVTGDVTQIDVAGGRSGLIGLETILSGIEGLSFIRLGEADVVRNQIVREIVLAYDRNDARAQANAEHVTIEVVVANEQSELEIDAARSGALAKSAVLAERVAQDAELSLVFVDEQAIATLNERYLGKVGPTDVLSFPLEDEPAPDSDTGRVREVPLLLGDVVICPKVAARNAPEHAGTFEDEIALLVVHGVLHILGHDHERDDEAEEMEAREQQLLLAFFDSEATGR